MVLSEAEQEIVFSLAASLTGTCQEGKARHSVIIANVQRRMQRCGYRTLEAYLLCVEQDDNEYDEFISAVTIHTTSWFREPPHFERLEAFFIKFREREKKRKLRVLCAACSTGEEVYSCALLFEYLNDRSPEVDYEIVGRDIDPRSIAKARSALYELPSSEQIPKKYHKFLRKEEGANAGTFSLDREIRSRCHFYVHDLTDLSPKKELPFDIIVCRNVLIYFAPEAITPIILHFKDLLDPEGMLCLGHSEAHELSSLGFTLLGNACYLPRKITVATHTKRNILVVDDSPTVCKALKLMLEKEGMEVQVARNASEASKVLQSGGVDLITLDLHMPGVSGQDWLKTQRINGMRLPVVILSGASPHEASEVLGVLETGAQDYIDKSALQGRREDVISRIVALADGPHHHPHEEKHSPANFAGRGLSFSPEVILIGASTGGTNALMELLKRAPPDAPPIVVTQHITKNFARAFAERLASSAGLTLCSNPSDSPLLRGHLYMPFDDYHIGIKQVGSELRSLTSDGPLLNRHRPSVDYLFESALTIRTNRICAILLTGMGTDGAKGLLQLKEKGAATFAQDADSCVVFGMPKEAIRLGATTFVGNLREMREELNKVLV